MYKETFAERLQKARKNAGFTQVEVAKELNISRSTLANYEIGRNEPDIETLGILASFYDVSVDWLLSMAPQKKNKQI